MRTRNRFSAPPASAGIRAQEAGRVRGARLPLAVLMFALALQARGEGLREGVAIPEFSAFDLNGSRRTSSDWLKQPAVVLIIPSRKSSVEADRWVQELVPSVAEDSLLGLIALDLPFFVSEGRARRKARSSIPREAWSRTLLAGTGEVRELLGLQPGPHPYVVIVNERGIVTWIFRGPPRSRDVRQAVSAWRALTSGAARGN